MARKASDQIAHRIPCRAPPASGRDDEIGAAAFFTVGHLQLQNRCQLVARHAAARQHTRALHMGRRRNYNGGITPPPSAFFKQQRHIQNHHLMTAVLVQKSALNTMHHRMHQTFQFFQRHRIVENSLP